MALDTARRERRSLLVAPAVVAGAALAGVGVLRAVDVATVSVLPPCPFRALTGLWCPFCGGTRSLDALVAGDLVTAVGFNLLVVLAVPLVTADWARWTAGRARGRPTTFLNVSTRVLAVLTALALAYAVLRNLPGLAMLGPGLESRP